MSRFANLVADLVIRLLTNIFLNSGIVGYRTFPTASIDGQLEDLRIALRLIHRMTSGKIVLLGHSSGAHLASLHTLRANSEGSCGDFDSQGLGSTGYITDVVCLSAPFDLLRHHHFEARRGAHILSPMAAAARPQTNLERSSWPEAKRGRARDVRVELMASAISCDSDSPDGEVDVGGCDRSGEASRHSFVDELSEPGLASRLWHHSPIQLAQRLTPDAARQLPRFLIVHGTRDSTVPLGQAADFALALRSRGATVETLWLDRDHLTFLSLMHHHLPLSSRCARGDAELREWLRCLATGESACPQTQLPGVGTSLERVSRL